MNRLKVNLVGSKLIQNVLSGGNAHSCRDGKMSIEVNTFENIQCVINFALIRCFSDKMYTKTSLPNGSSTGAQCNLVLKCLFHIFRLMQI